MGKSTLINKLIGEKITITSPIAQTTRNKLKGILTTDNGQIIFVDTPGVHKPHHRLGEILVKNAKSAINGVDMSKLQSFPEKNSFSSYFFLCDIDGHIESPKIKNSLEELGLHCQDMHVLGVYKSDKFRQK